jgi:hypothetical protein
MSRHGVTKLVSFFDLPLVKKEATVLTAMASPKTLQRITGKQLLMGTHGLKASELAALTAKTKAAKEAAQMASYQKFIPSARTTHGGSKSKKRKQSKKIQKNKKSKTVRNKLKK